MIKNMPQNFAKAVVFAATTFLAQFAAAADFPVGSYIQPIRDTSICRYAETIPLLRTVGRGTDQAQGIADGGKCGLILIASERGSGGARSAYQILADKGQGVLAVEETDDGITSNHVLGYADANDFAPAAPPAPPKTFIALTPAPIGCPSPDDWVKIMNDPNRQNQTAASEPGYVASFGCQIVAADPASIWTEIGSSRSGQLLQLRQGAGDGSNLFYRSDAFGPVEMRHP